MPEIFLITSATGRQGTSTARLLLAQGAQVHALVRDPTSPESLALKSMGATLFKGGFDLDVSALAPRDAGREARAAERFVAAAHAAGTVKSFVVSTVFKADAYANWEEKKAEIPFLSQYYGSKAGVERVVRASGLTYMILRPGWLMHNYIALGPRYHFPEYASERVLAVSCPRDWRMEHFDADDVGQFAAAALLDPKKFSGKEIDLINEQLTFEEIARDLSEAIGAEVKVKYRTEEETKEALKVVPGVERQIWAPMLPYPDSTKLVEYGFRLTTFKEFLEREKNAIKKTVGVET
ncbi:NmrA domain-containing protein [Mycena venus]|uniref:NmrA domain-containing protein n=1 Tax=Mycena venus TaxID=2733690 RepID=A0A8H7D3A3_9AGAR|nr:NmrA domain-containing protein [Mycena venus]